MATLEQWSYPRFHWWLVLGKIPAHWLESGLPLVFMAGNGIHADLDASAPGILVVVLLLKPPAASDWRYWCSAYLGAAVVASH